MVARLSAAVLMGDALDADFLSALDDEYSFP
jgi:hypothetical protein